MNYRIFWEENYATIEYEPSKNIARVSWKGYQFVRDIKFAFEKLIEVIIVKSCRKVIFDNTWEHSHWVALESWIVNDWLPRALVCNLRAVAFIYSIDSNSENALLRLANRINFDCAAKSFSSQTKANAWFDKIQV